MRVIYRQCATAQNPDKRRAAIPVFRNATHTMHAHKLKSTRRECRAGSISSSPIKISVDCYFVLLGLVVLFELLGFEPVPVVSVDGRGCCMLLLLPEAMPVVWWPLLLATLLCDFDLATW